MTTSSHSMLILGLNNLIFNGRSISNSEPPTEDKVIKVDVGDQARSKLISISESLSPIEKQGLISLIREYINVFTWSYEDMLGLDPQVAIHHLNIK